MARKKQTRGDCGYCGRQMTRGGLAKHLRTCAARRDAIEAADKKSGPQQPVYHLQVQDAWGGDYWLHLEMKGTAPLKELDRYLRAIWLECCGHLSQISVGGPWQGDEIALSKKASQVFEPGLELTHIYDFGTSSETLVKVVDARTGHPTSKYPLALLARNDAPDYPCMLCDQVAEWLCMQCMYEEDASGALCADHAKDHPHDDYGGLYPFVNSPRVGMCGYDGPATPPY